MRAISLLAAKLVASGCLNIVNCCNQAYRKLCRDGTPDPVTGDLGISRSLSTKLKCRAATAPAIIKVSDSTASSAVAKSSGRRRCIRGA